MSKENYSRIATKIILKIKIEKYLKIRVNECDGMKDEIDEVVRYLKKYPNVAAIILFGSSARGKTKPLSDIDIAVIIKKPSKKIEADVSSLSSNLLDVVNFHRLPLYIQFEVLKYGQPLFIKDKKYFLKVKMEVLREYLEMSHLYERMRKRVLSR
mgnify:CR=1 FL=1